jgi:hypothetical protein
LAEHSDLAIRVGQRGRPGDGIGAVDDFGGVKYPVAIRAAAPARFLRDDGVAAANGLNRVKFLGHSLFPVRGADKQHRPAPLADRSVDVGAQHRPVAHGRRNVEINRDRLWLLHLCRGRHGFHSAGLGSMCPAAWRDCMGWCPSYQVSAYGMGAGVPQPAQVFRRTVAVRWGD